MPDSLDLIFAIGKALDTFHFSNYGCDEIDEVISDPELELRDALATHIMWAVEKLLED